MNKYQDIIKIEHYEPKRHKRMSIANRAAQFAPFAALTGYNDAVNEVGRITNEQIMLSEDEREIINEKIRKIKENIKNKPTIKITYFIADLFKDGGSYVTIKEIVRRIDEGRQLIILNNKKEIKMRDIIEIELNW